MIKKTMALTIIACIIVAFLYGCNNNLELSDRSYTVAFDLGIVSDIEQLPDVEVKGGSSTPKPSDLYIDGYSFLGWYKDSALTVAYDFSSPIINNTIIYAKFIAVDLSLYYFEPIGDNEYGIGTNIDLIGDIVLPSSYNSCAVTQIKDFGFYKQVGITSVVIPRGIHSIGRYAFSGNTSLKKLHLTSDIATIKDYAFYDCTSLTNINLSDIHNLVCLGSYAFCNCSALSNIILSGNFTKVNRGLFYGCQKLTSVSLPESVNIIDDFAFYDCYLLSQATVPCQTPPQVGTLAFLENDLLRIFVPEESLDLYSNSNDWTRYTAYLTSQ